MQAKPFDLDHVLMEFSDSTGRSYWTIREAVEGVQIFGGIGSGKTSGSGRTLALKYLANGFGGLVLTVKPDEKDLWLEYCTKTNRLNDLIIVSPNSTHHFNFLEYESTHKDGVESFTENIVQVLKTVIRSSEEKSGGKSDTKETALRNNLNMWLRPFSKEINDNEVTVIGNFDSDLENHITYINASPDLIRRINEHIKTNYIPHSNSNSFGI